MARGYLVGVYGLSPHLAYCKARDSEKGYGGDKEARNFRGWQCVASRAVVTLVDDIDIVF